MPDHPTEQSNPSVAVELKSGSITLPILKVLSADLSKIDAQLHQKLGKAPDFFRNAPIIIDLGQLPEREKAALDFMALLKTLSTLALAPVGMRGGNAAHQGVAKAEKIAVLAEVRTENTAPAQDVQRPATQRNIPPPRPMVSSTKVVDQPVRSGQRIYATGGDLIVLAQVSYGAEIMADGNIHVYGALKGRALAGVQGNLEARIFCSDLQAQLIAIGGNYRTYESEDDSMSGRLVQVHLQDDALVVTPL